MKSCFSTHPLRAARPPAAALAVAGVLALAAVAYVIRLWPEWRQNPDLSHGFFVPLIGLLLVWESRRQGPLRWIRAGAIPVGIQTLLLLLVVSLLVLAGLFAASLAWSHALVLFLLALALCCLLFAGLLVLADERLRVVPFNWISLTAVFLWILSAPIPDGTYARLTLALQNWITGGVMGFLHFFGVPARQHGNVIELARTSVGVEEACSGIRSLISCLFAGFFFSAWQVRRPQRRLVLVALAPLLALGMNFLRSLTLTLLANAGTDISGAWHDATGYAILGVTAAILAGIAILLESKESAEPPAPAEAPAYANLRWLYGRFWGGTALALAVGVFFFANSRMPVGTEQDEAPALASFLPAEAPGWKVSTPKDLYRFADVLQTTYLLQRTYLRPADNGDVIQLTVYVAYWPAGQVPVSRVAAHTPDACWPGSGWFAQGTTEQHRQETLLPGLQLSPAEYRLFRSDSGYPQYVWFWHIFDGRVIDHRDPYSLPALLKIALQYGFRRQGSQYFVRISSNRPWNEIASEPLLREILTNLDRVGL